MFTPLINYKKNECFSEKKIKDTVNNAIQTRLFQTIYYELDPVIIDNKSLVNVIYKVEERKHRTYSYGVGFSDTESMIVSAGNEWRNINKRGINANINTRLSALSQTLTLNGQYPSIRGKRQNINGSAQLGRIRNDTYDTDGLSTFVGYERLSPVNQNLSWGAGLRNTFSKVKNSAILSDEYFLSTLPIYGFYNGKDDFLRPTEGSTLRLEFEPAIDLYNGNNHFFKNGLTASHYIDVGTIGSNKLHSPTILAFRSSVGSIWGSSFNDIPITERYFAGGGGSVRGYAYQQLGDLTNNLPSGGSSIFESSAEVRIGIYQDWGLNLFVDAGNVYETVTPQINQNLQYSAGLGGRYYSDVIPIRMDIGFPLNPRDGRSDNFGFYVGIGENF